jgi:hypothetical protein
MLTRSGTLAVASFIAVGIAGGALGTTFVLARPQALLGRGFDSALGNLQRRTGAGPATNPISESPYFRLSRAGAEDLTSRKWNSFRIGDRITLASGDDQQKVFEIIAVRELETGIARVDDAAGTKRFLLVTSREIDASEPHLMRFIVESDEPEGLPLVPQTQRTL